MRMPDNDPPSGRFVAIDVETANADMASICQIGLAVFEDGSLRTEWKTLVDPEDYFDWINVEIHGITEDDVYGAPKFPELLGRIEEFLSGQVVVCHTHFDRISIGRALQKHGLSDFPVTWLDSARVARRTWPECAWSGYGLANVCNLIGYQFKHHDALEDAKAAGQVLLAAMNKTGLTLQGWMDRVTRPIDPTRFSTNIARDGNPDGPMYGEVMVFTGSLGITRNEAADLASRLGCRVATSVTKKTSIMVVGDQDVSKLNGADKSSKHRRAEELIAAGQSIRVIRESDFMALVNTIK